MNMSETSARRTLREAVVASTGSPQTQTIYSTGKRKNAVARVWIFSGNGDFTVNEKPYKLYFDRQVHYASLEEPLKLVNRLTHYSVWCTVKGGGHSGQAGAIRHGIACALNKAEGDLRTTLKKNGLLTRDSRIVERKKPGKPKARRSVQFSKR